MTLRLSPLIVVFALASGVVSAAKMALPQAQSAQRQAAIASIESLYAAALSRCDSAPMGVGVILCHWQAWRQKSEALRQLGAGE